MFGFIERRRAADSYRPESPHPFTPIRDGGLGRLRERRLATDNYLRKSGCAVPACGKPTDDAIHTPAD